MRKKLSKLQRGNGIESSSIDNPRSGILSRGSLSSDEDMLDVKQQTVSHPQDSNQLFERSIRVDDAASHCEYLKQ